MEIDQARPDDIPALCDLLASLFAQEAEFKPDRDAQRKGLALIIDNPLVGEILVAREGHAVIGMINILYSISTAQGGRAAVFEDMIVDAQARGHGVGSALLQRAIGKARSKGCERISLLADNDNTRAHSFYLRHGFDRSGMVTFRLSLASE